jgi:hypothetical protein
MEIAAFFFVVLFGFSVWAVLFIAFIFAVIKKLTKD